jgi:hypothetical protein
MTPAGHAMTMENQADMLAEALWEKRVTVYGHTTSYVDTNTRKAIRRTMAKLQMVLDGDIRSPMDMAAEVEGRVDG